MGTWENDVERALEALNDAWFAAMEDDNFDAADAIHAAYRVVDNVLPQNDREATN